MTNMLTKSSFIRSIDCPIRLRLISDGAPSREQDDDALQLRAEGWYQFEALVRHAWPGEKLGGGVPDADAAHERTLSKLREMLRTGEGTIYEAVLKHGGLFARSDMIRIRGGRIELCEIKAKSFPGPAEPRDANELLAFDSVNRGEEGSIFSKRGGVTAHWRENVAEIGFQMIVAERAFTAAGIDLSQHPIVPCLVVANKNVTCGVSDQFGNIRVNKDDSRRVRGVEWVDEPAKGFCSPLIVILDVTKAVEQLRKQDAGSGAEGWRGKPLDEIVESALASMSSPEKLDPLAERGVKCKDCVFNCTRESEDGSIEDGLNLCWGERADEARELLDLYQASSYTGLPGGARWVHELLQNSSAIWSIGSLPAGPNPISARQIEAAKSNCTKTSDDLASVCEAKLMPAKDCVCWFIDFETSMACMSHFEGMRPYEAFAFQFSAHGVPVCGGVPQWGEVVHREWLFDYTDKELTIAKLDVEFVLALKAAVTDPGPIFHWSPHEKAILHGIYDRLAKVGTRTDLEQEAYGFAATLFADLVDLYPLAHKNICHPLQQGSFSVKRLLPAICSEVAPRTRVCELMESFSGVPAQAGECWDPYQELLRNSLDEDEGEGEGEESAVREQPTSVESGTDAMQAFNRLRYGDQLLKGYQRSEDDSSLIKGELANRIKEYCKLDTVAMVVIWEWMLKLGGVLEPQELAATRTLAPLEPRIIEVEGENFWRNYASDLAKVGYSQVERIVERPMRRRLHDTRQSITHKFNVGGHEGYLIVGLYDDGRPGELCITMAKEGPTIGGLMDSLGTAISVALQYGVPVELLVTKFARQRFEPMGITTNHDIPFAKSLVDYIFRWFGMQFIAGYRDAEPERTMPPAAAVQDQAASAKKNS